jgi:predicted negative regulator of RcsB-dependent stress response
MDTITGYMSAHPAIVVTGVVIIIVLFLHFTFKSLIKLLFIVLIILLAIFGYYSFKNQGTNNESTATTQSVVDNIKDKSKNFANDIKELYRKGKAGPKEVNKMLDASDKEMEKEMKKK